MKKLFQPFHLVSLSPWPILLSFTLLNFMFSVIAMFHYNNIYMVIFNYLTIILCMYQWWRDVTRESTYQGYHTNKVIEGLKLGMMLFIISEIFFFISIFWCFMHMFLSPSIEIGSNWPPKNIIPFNPYFIPLLNTIILLSSGMSITWCHYSIIMSKYKISIISLFITVMLGIIFTLYQWKEYNDASFSISDSIYGSIFFMSTGFHGLHVIIGTIFLVIILFRMILNNFSKNHHFGFEAAAWYWHFVDVVWLFLFLLIYVWSN
nr:cytochrome c oxidase subunit III [Pachycrepoideus vindemmiae]